MQCGVAGLSVQGPGAATSTQLGQMLPAMLHSSGMLLLLPFAMEGFLHCLLGFISYVALVSVLQGAIL